MPLTTAFSAAFVVTVMLTWPETFHTRYAPFAKSAAVVFVYVGEPEFAFGMLRVSRTAPVFASVTVIVSLLPP